MLARKLDWCLVTSYQILDSGCLTLIPKDNQPAEENFCGFSFKPLLSLERIFSQDLTALFKIVPHKLQRA